MHERSKTLMETGLEKIRNNILIGLNQSPQSSNQMAQEPMNQLSKGLDEARDFCGNSETAQNICDDAKQSLSNLANNMTPENMNKVANHIQNMQRQVGIQQMQSAIQQTQNGIQQAHNDLNSQESLQAGQNAIQGLQQIQQGLNAGSMTQAQKGLNQVQNATKQMQSANKANSPIANQGIKQMQDGFEQMQSAMGNLSNDNLNETGQLNDEGDAAVSKMQNACEELKDEVTKGQNQQGQNQQGQNQQGQGQPSGQGQSGSQGQGQPSGQGAGQPNNAGIGQQTSDIRSTNTKLNSGMDNLGNAIGGQGQGQGQQNNSSQGGQGGQGSGQQGQGQGQQGSSGDPNRTSSGAPKNPFEDAQQKGKQGQGQGQGQTGVKINGQSNSGNGNGNGNGQGEGFDKGLDKTPGTVGQGENVTGQSAGNGISGGFSRDSFSTEKSSGIADTTKLNKQAEKQELIGKPQYGDNDFASGKADVDQSLSKEVTVTYNGKKLTGTVNMDILSNHDKLHQQAGGSATEKRIEESKMALQNIKTKLELEKQKNSDLDKDSAGKHSDRFIEFGLETNMSWKKLLRRCLQKERRGSSYSYLQPNRRYSNMGMTVVSRVKDKKVDVIKNIKVCVDTSGSVSPEELNLYLSQIARLTKEFDNVEGELLYWSNAVTDAGPFKNIEDLKKIHVGSTGGTDVRCVFEYLNGETKVDGKYEKHKPKEMAAVIIITDGCFYNNYEDYLKIFGKPSYKVIWMIEGNAMEFNPPFGNVVQITRQGD